MSSLAEDAAIAAEIAEDWFSKHKATLSVFRDGMGIESPEKSLGEITLINWQEPGSWNCAVRYIIHRHALMIYGDLGDAVFIWGQPLSLGFLRGLQVDYFASKCQASESGRGGRAWNRDRAEQNLRGALKARLGWKFNHDGPLYSTFRDLEPWQINDALANQHAWVDLLSNRPKLFNGDELGLEVRDCADFGMEITRRVRGFLVGLKMAAKQLDAKQLDEAHTELDEAHTEKG